jgi:hypothetical protein
VLNKFAAALVGSPGGAQPRTRAASTPHSDNTKQQHEKQQPAGSGAKATPTTLDANGRTTNTRRSLSPTGERSQSTPQASATPASSVTPPANKAADTKAADSNDADADDGGGGLVGSMFSMFTRKKSKSQGKTAKMGEDLKMEYNKKYKMWLPKVTHTLVVL